MGNLIQGRSITDISTLTGNGKVVEIGASGDNLHVTSTSFTPSSYTGRITSAEAGTTFAIASGARKVMFQCLDMAASGTAEYAVVAFGTSAADAQTNLGKTGTTPNIISNTGFVVGSSTKVGEPSVIVGIPSDATHCAVGNGIAATTIALMVTQGS